MTNYEQLLTLSASLDPAAREYVVALLGEHREMREALQGMIAANVPGNGVPMTDAMREAYITARAILAKVQAP